MMGYRLPSYRAATCCPDTHCNHDSQDQPCWGNVEVRGESDWGDDWSWIHACEGHADSCEGGPYRLSDCPEDQGVSPIEDDN
jgi:hypothetical protein